MTLAHAAAVHVPLGIAVVVPFVVFALWVGQRRLQWAPSTWWLAVGLQAVVAGSAMVSANLGEREEEAAEMRVGGERVHEHEEAAEAFVLGSIGLLVLLVAGGVVRRAGVQSGLQVAGAVVALGTLALGARAGHEGGELVRGDGARPDVGGEVSPEGGREKKRRHHDDD